MHGSPSGTPGRCAAQSSSLPANSSRASQWSRIERTDAAVSVGYSGTETWPAIQIARSAMIQWAQFFDTIAIAEPGGRSSDLRCEAMRRTSPAICAQLSSRTGARPAAAPG